MHVLFVHQNFPAQFGHIASYLARTRGFRTTFVSEKPPGVAGGVERIQYRIRGGATPQTHYCSRTFENAVWHAHAIFEALQARPDIRPDLVVAHSGFSTAVFLRELYECPIVSYFEYFYRTRGSDMDFRPDFPCSELARLRAHTRNAALLLDLENCDAGYSPTRWQHSRLPATYHEKVRVIFDGIDTTLWKRTPDASRVLAGRPLPDGTRLVTYVSRGMESMRGFDVFLRVAKRLCDERSNVVFAVVGEDRVCYGGDENFTGGKSFKQWILDQDDYDLSRICFVGRLPPHELARLLSASDLHVYLTVPFGLSWSLLNALACGAVVLASDTAPVREMITPGTNGLLADFFDVDGFVRAAGEVLDDPQAFRPLGDAGPRMIAERYSLDVCLPQMLELYESVTR
ncbi:MAG TPA: glycosyltransferase [Planctomycetaceae bacterium]|nr:glycosyltransferase [Planctomycetaceae bacterium]